MQRIRDINAVSDGRQGNLDAFEVLNLHPGQAQRSLDRTRNGNVLKIVYGAQHPERFQKDGLAYPYLFDFEECACTQTLRLVIVDQQPYEHIRIDCDHRKRSALPVTVPATNFASNTCLEVGQRFGLSSVLKRPEDAIDMRRWKRALRSQQHPTRGGLDDELRAFHPPVLIAHRFRKDDLSF